MDEGLGGFGRREFLAVAGGMLGASARGVEAAAPPRAARAPDAGPRQVGDRKQLFIDRRFIAASEHVALAMNPAQKLGVVLDAGNSPWERGQGGYFRIVEDGGKLKMYYGAFLTTGQGLCYAESDDGLHWTKPALGLVEINASKVNNVLYPDDAIDATIFIDPNDVPARRYKLFRSLVTSDPARAGVYASYSADGLHFTEAGRVLPMWPETSLIADWDPRIKKYTVFLRVFVRDNPNQRRAGRIETDDLLKPWPYRPTDPLLSPPSPANIPQVLSVDGDDGPDCDIYTNAACRYPDAEDVYLMFPAMFRHFSPHRQPWFRFKPGDDNGLIEVQLAVSRDGVRWERPDRRPYFPMGLPDEWDRWLAMMGVGMVRRGNALYQYYWSSGRMHDAAILRPEYDKSAPTRGGIGALRQRPDGFISADFAHTGGTLTTPPLLFGGSHLRLNIDTGGMGTAFVEIRDDQGRPIPGFALADCEEIGGNFLDTPVRWKGKADLSALRGRPVVLHVSARRAKLFALQFPSGPSPT